MQSKFIKTFAAGLAVILLLIFVNGYGGENRLRGLVFSVFRKPLEFSFNLFNQTKHRVGSWFKTGNLLKENEALKSENRALVSIRLKISELEKENDYLRKGLGVAKRKNWEVVMARVFHRQIDNQKNTALISAGADEGIKAGRPVVFDGEIIYGVVKEVYTDTALIYLITDSRVNINVKVEALPDEVRGEEISGKARGALVDGLDLELIANQEKVEPGQLVITSGLDGLPPALVVGKIKTAQAGRGELFQKIEIEPAFKNLLVDRVFILK